ncbi:winged helix-turn-helix domain-containing protein (plasmid) [Streptomyces sp. CA-294286]|uniref:winged helix-turn-helix domain-containing protein n=1 Tax=Streptomyces sp. CA-294286 TaxID=3240070 RepID=UPI003D9463D0
MSIARTPGHGFSQGTGFPELRREEGPPAPWRELAHASWFALPPSALPAPPGRPALAGYLVLVPTDAEAPGTPPAPALAQQIQVNTDSRTVTVAGHRLHLTRLEFDLFAHLVAHPRRVHTREMLYAALWPSPVSADHRTIDVHIARLRRKLGSSYRKAIETVRGVGYRYVAC